MASLARITADLMGREYSLGRSDCFRVLADYLEARGAVITWEHDGLNMDNYAEVYRADPERAIAAIWAVLDAALVRVDPAARVAGDILRIRPTFGKVRRDSPAIDAGGGNAIVASERLGSTSAGLDRYEITGAWRWEH